MKRNHIIIITALVILIGIVGFAYATNPTTFEVPKQTTPDCMIASDQIFNLINNDRHLFNIPSAQFDSTLTHDAIEISRNIPYNQISKPWDKFDHFVISKKAWTQRYYSSPQYNFDIWTNTDMNFRNDVRNRDYNRVGVGVSSDSVNYYIVILWK